MFLKQLFESRYYRNVLTLITGSGLSQLILIGLTPLLTRVFSPEEFGAYATFLALILILATIATGRFEIGILIPEKSEEAFGLYFISIFSALIFSCLLFLLAPFLVRIEWVQKLLDPGLSQYYFLLPIGILLHSVLVATSYLANRFKAYRQLSEGRIAGSSSNGLLSLALGVAGLTAIGLFLGKIVSLFLETWFTGRKLLGEIKKAGSAIHRADLYKLMARYRNLPLFSAPEGLLNTGFRQLPVLALTVIYSPELAGFYGLAASVLSKPLGTISTAFGQVFFQRAAQEADNTSALQRLFRNDLLFLFSIGVIPCCLLMWWAPNIFAFVFGEEWYTAGLYTTWLMPLFFLTFLKTPFSCMVDIKNRIQQNILFEGAFLLWSLVCFYLASQGWPALKLIQWYSLGCTFLGLFQLAWFYWLTRVEGGW
ncbi:MAG: polysaccharide biosynthesis protein [Saprospiraceae bacterium]|nr:MAG: polysaccharide biosynthesis protein [Saprospiraceae bacterium]